ncbi:hypothetical protein J4734_29565, partial [Klebsiella pneumoniae]|nr:hypothetical protein [Klebsiella pneumoniae]
YAGWRHKCLIRPYVPSCGSRGQAQRRRTLQAPYLWLCRMAASMPYPACSPHTHTPDRQAQPPGGQLHLRVPDGGIHALSGL